MTRHPQQRTIVGSGMARAWSLVLRAVRDRRGVAAVEFAVILPVMLTLYVGTIDGTRLVMAARKADIVSRTISDLVAQQPSTPPVTSSTIATIFNAAAAIMAPFPTTSLTLTVSAIAMKPQSNGLCCNATVNWSYTQGGTLRPCNVNLTLADPGVAAAPTNLPKALIMPSASVLPTSTQVPYLIVADVGYTYKPFFVQALTWFTGAIKKTTYMVPRAFSGQVTLASPVNAASGQSGAICS